MENRYDEHRKIEYDDEPRRIYDNLRWLGFEESQARRIVELEYKPESITGNTIEESKNLQPQRHALIRALDRTNTLVEKIGEPPLEERIMQAIRERLIKNIKDEKTKTKKPNSIESDVDFHPEI